MLFGIFANAQPTTAINLQDIEKKGCVAAEEGKVKICKFDYEYKNQTVEALIFRRILRAFSRLDARSGLSGTAKTYFSFGLIFAKLGFASVTVGTPVSAEPP